MESPLEIATHRGKDLRVHKFDTDKDLPIDVTDLDEDKTITLYLTVAQTEDLIAFLQEQLKTLE